MMFSTVELETIIWMVAIMTMSLMVALERIRWMVEKIMILPATGMEPVLASLSIALMVFSLAYKVMPLVISSSILKRLKARTLMTS